MMKFCVRQSDFNPVIRFPCRLKFSKDKLSVHLNHLAWDQLLCLPVDFVQRSLIIHSGFHSTIIIVR